MSSTRAVTGSPSIGETPSQSVSSPIFIGGIIARYDAVLSYHTNALTCGVAKFNQQLAQRLGVPCESMTQTAIGGTGHKLVSVKPSEIASGEFYWSCDSYDLLLHERHDWIVEHPISLCAGRVFYADELGCPSTIAGNPSRGRYNVLTFGMAHKLVLPHFRALKAQLDLEHSDYTVSLSTAVHEGTSWDTAFHESTDAMRAIFGDRLRVLGFLADDALAKELQECDAVAAYFVPALRANNTSAWAAVAAGKYLYTNTDEHSPDLTKPPTWDGLIEKLTA